MSDAGIDEMTDQRGVGDAAPKSAPETNQASEPPLARASQPDDGESRAPRPLVERLGMAAIAVVLAAVFAVMAVAAFNGGEPFLGVMAGAGSLMTLWVGGLTLRRG